MQEELDNITRKIDQDDTFLSYHESDSSLVESFSGIDQIISSFLKSCSVLENKKKEYEIKKAKIPVSVQNLSTLKKSFVDKEEKCRDLKKTFQRRTGIITPPRL